MLLRSLTAFAVALIVIGSCAGPVLVYRAVESGRREMRALADTQSRMLDQIQTLRRSIETRDAVGWPTATPDPINMDVAIAGTPRLGQPSAAVTMIEFSDYQCAYCRKYATEIFTQIDRDYIQTGKVLYVFRALPLERIHPDSRRAARAAWCAYNQRRYLPFREVLFQQGRFDDGGLLEAARASGLELISFASCSAAKDTDEAVSLDLKEASRLGLQSTPTFLMGLTVKDGSHLKVAAMVRGARPYAAFKAAIDRLLATR